MMNMEFLSPHSAIWNLRMFVTLKLCFFLIKQNLKSTGKLHSQMSYPSESRSRQSYGICFKSTQPALCAGPIRVSLHFDN